ncbi:unnamed protein product [Victoria cruziana]
MYVEVTSHITEIKERNYVSIEQAGIDSIGPPRLQPEIVQALRTSKVEPTSMQLFSPPSFFWFVRTSV